MGKGNDPNCAAAVPMLSADIGAEEVFVQPKVDRVRVRQLPGGFRLVGYEPGSSDGRKSAFFTDEEGYEEIATAPDPAAVVRRPRKLRQFQQIASAGMEKLTTIPMELMHRHGFEVDEIFEPDPVAVVRDGRFDPEMLLRMDTDHTFWKPNAQTPLSRAYHVELWGTHIDVEEALATVQDRDFVLNAEVKRNPVSLNWGISGRNLMHVTVLLPQDVHDRLYEARTTTGPHRVTHFSPSVVEEAFRYEYIDRDLPDDLKDLMGLAPFRLNVQEEQRKQDDENYFY